MRLLKKWIAVRQEALKAHGLFTLLDETTSPEPLARLAHGCAWLPMAFQDVLRLNFERVQGTDFERYAQHHRDEDAGHDGWFLDDLRVFGVEEPGLAELFSDDFRPIRDACYSLTAGVQRDLTGGQRIAFVLAMEAAGHVFFEHMAAAVDRVCPELPLRYFARFHLGVEKSHDLFTEQTDADLDGIVLSEEERREAETIVDGVCRTFSGVFDYYALRMRETAPRRSLVQQLGGTGSTSIEMQRAHGS